MSPHIDQPIATILTMIDNLNLLTGSGGGEVLLLVGDVVLERRGNLRLEQVCEG